jgi:hypothetical protein
MLECGSKWRRWDLHIHTPDTANNDQFTDWDNYLAALEGQSEVKVLGVTDYLTINNYSKLKAFRDAGRLKNIDCLIPNIEFRLAPPTDKDTPVNIHLLISPEATDHEQHINDALARLHVEYNKHQYSCTREQLIAMGRAVDPSITDDRGALDKGASQFKVDFSKLRSWFEQERWLSENSIIAVSGNKDGLSGFLIGGGWAATREEITRFSKVIFCGRPGEIDFWLGREQPTNRIDFMRKLGGPKPCIHGSDAHKLEELFKPDNGRFCWIKADTNFEGLKQILLEPAERVHIGPTPPAYHDQARVIESVRLDGGGAWFQNISIPLNRGLISIIGQKGSGKSALAELTAFAAGSWEPADSGSFLRRAGNLLNNLTVTLTWADGRQTSRLVGEGPLSTQGARYLSQRFVEKLCSDDRLGEELVREIEGVIFAYLDPTDTLNASSFQELRALKTDAITNEGGRLREDISRLIREEMNLRNTRAGIAQKRQQKDKLAAEASGLAKQIPVAATKQEQDAQTALLTKRTRLGELQNQIALLKQKRQRVLDLRSSVQAFSRDITRFEDEITPLLRGAGIPESEWPRFKPIFAQDYERSLQDRDNALNANILRLEGTPEKQTADCVASVQREIDELSKLESEDKARQNRVREIQTRLAAIAAETSRLDDEISQAEPLKLTIETTQTKRRDTYASYFSNLREEENVLRELYGPVHDKFASDTSSPHERELEFSIRRDINLDAWLERGGTLFDQRKTVPFGTMQELAKKARSILVPAWSSGDPAIISSAHENFLKAFRDKNLPSSAYARAGITPQDILLWLYDVDHIRLSYGLKYRGTELEKLSPGTKGIVLLILYLGMDLQDTRPLIVDQPDENLDNESIYALLTEYFRSAKKRRQIILITHNPNLVVNGDSEQVIVASAAVGKDGLPQITYDAGSLENSAVDGTGIRQKTCRILEGGNEAFLRRERRYSISNPGA